MVRLNFIKPNLTPSQMAEKRRKLLTFAMVAFALWQLSRIISEVANPLGHSGTQWFVLDEFGDMCLGGFSVAIVAIVFFVQRLFERPRLASMLNDELYSQNRLKAGYFAFFSMLASAALTEGFASFHPLTAVIAANIAILIGCTTFLGSTIYLDRE